MNGHAEGDNRGRHADLPLLHALLGHYARQLWDVQKVRVAMSNRAWAMEQDGLSPEWYAGILQHSEELERWERAINGYLDRLSKQHFMRPWINEQIGIGLPGFARLLGATGTLDRFATVSKLWRYMGMAVDNGEAPHRERGVKLNYSPQGRIVCHQIGDAFVKVNRGPWRELYDRKRAEYFSRPRTGESGCPMGQVHKDTKHNILPCVRPGPDGEISGHLHSAARRYAVKQLLKAMWIEWRRATGGMLTIVRLPAAESVREEVRR